jgi:DNA mismatch repair protein MutS
MKEFSYMQFFKEKYNQFKEKYGDAIILFRCSDLYMAIEDDATACQEALGLTLSISTSDRIKSTAFPSHCLDTYLPKLVRAGHRICICDNPCH